MVVCGRISHSFCVKVHSNPEVCDSDERRFEEDGWLVPQERVQQRYFWREADLLYTMSE